MDGAALPPILKMNIRFIKDTAETCPLFPFEKPHTATHLTGCITISACPGLSYRMYTETDEDTQPDTAFRFFNHGDVACVKIPLTASRDAINDFMREHEAHADNFINCRDFIRCMKSCLYSHDLRGTWRALTEGNISRAERAATKAIDRIATAAAAYDWETPPEDDRHFHYNEEGEPDRPLRDEEDPWEIDRTPERNGFQLVTMLTSVRYAVEYGTDEVADEFTAAQRRAIRDFSRKYTTPDLAKCQNGRDCSISFDTCDITGERGECATYWVYPEAKLRREIRKRERAAATANGKETTP